MGVLRRALLGDGRLPDDLRTQLTAESLRVVSEELPGSITYRNYRAPGRRSSFRKEPTSGAIAISAQRLVVWANRAKHMDVPLAHPLLAALEVQAEAPDRICLAYEASAFNPATSGRVELRFTTPLAADIAELMTSAR